MPRKRIALIVEGEGSCPEDLWASIMVDHARNHLHRDDAGVDMHARVTGAVPLTSFGTTAVQTTEELEAGIARMGREADKWRPDTWGGPDAMDVIRDILEATRGA